MSNPQDPGKNSKGDPAKENARQDMNRTKNDPGADEIHKQTKREHDVNEQSIRPLDKNEIRHGRNKTDEGPEVIL